jgi:ribosomal protein L29
MKRSDLAELRSKPADELKKIAADLREQLFRGRLNQSNEGKGLGGKVRQMRRQVARLETILFEQRAGITHVAKPVSPKPAATTASAPAPKKAKAAKAAVGNEASEKAAKAPKKVAKKTKKDEA